MVREVPETVQISGVADVKTTESPDVAVATSVIGLAEYVRLPGPP